MSRVITFSRTFPAYHSKAGQPTYFVEKVLNYTWDNVELPGFSGAGVLDMLVKLNPNTPKEILESINDSCDSEIREDKFHTIRAGSRWKVGDKFSPRVWSGKPYASKMIQFAPDIEIKKIWEIDIEVIYTEDEADMKFCVDGNLLSEADVYRLAKNDGLDPNDMFDWFSNSMSGQIICWNESIEY
jgi:hypothetical protein